MSIAEFLDGLPSYNEKNFSRFKKKSKSSQVSLSSDGNSPGNSIVKEKTQLLIRCMKTKQTKTSVAEFLDGLPSYSKKNFSRFKKKSKSSQVSLSSDGNSPGNSIVKDKTQLLIRCMKTKQTKTINDNKRVFEEIKDKVSSSCSKHSKIDSNEPSSTQEDSNDENGVHLSLPSTSK